MQVSRALFCHQPQHYMKHMPRMYNFQNSANTNPESGRSAVQTGFRQSAPFRSASDAESGEIYERSECSDVAKRSDTVLAGTVRFSE